MKSGVFGVLARVVFAAAIVSVLAALGASAADIVQSAGVEYTFGASDFMLNRDAVKEEARDNELCRVTPRLANSMVFSHFALPEGEQGRVEWTVTASVAESKGSAAGVGLWSADNGYVLCAYPDGSCFLRSYEGKKISWSQDVKVIGFEYPADLTIQVDVNGSVLGKVDNVIVAAMVVVSADLKKKSSPQMTSVSFVTNSPNDRAGAPVYYKSLSARASGK
jgi:hypothetical protein